MNSFRFVAHDLADTDRLGRVLAEILPTGTVVALGGTLGAGKTRLVQAIAAGCGIPREQVVSPTFVLCQEYCGQRTILHLDAYRLRNAEEFTQLGVIEMFESGDLILIEWADRVADALPATRVAVHIEVIEEEHRQLEITGYGALASIVSSLEERLAK